MAATITLWASPTGLAASASSARLCYEATSPRSRRKQSVPRSWRIPRWSWSYRPAIFRGQANRSPRPARSSQFERRWRGVPACRCYVHWLGMYGPRRRDPHEARIHPEWTRGPMGTVATRGDVWCPRMTASDWSGTRSQERTTSRSGNHSALMRALKRVTGALGLDRDQVQRRFSLFDRRLWPSCFMTHWTSRTSTGVRITWNILVTWRLWDQFRRSPIFRCYVEFCDPAARSGVYGRRYAPWQVAVHDGHDATLTWMDTFKEHRDSRTIWLRTTPSCSYRRQGGKPVSRGAWMVRTDIDSDSDARTHRWSCIYAPLVIICVCGLVWTIRDDCKYQRAIWSRKIFSNPNWKFIKASKLEWMKTGILEKRLAQGFSRDIQPARFERVTLLKKTSRFFERVTCGEIHVPRASRSWEDVTFFRESHVGESHVPKSFKFGEKRPFFE